ncbi:efflux transporter outer membrane subunit [Methylomagnum ishizawai]|uniref:efflux transporter outer membrane subunit n=1 Tax=Methylomagnum ishizawai TaxID=1760988 RepID=UPI001C332ED4|nr:efflux transporter outer membrane subunit [Methylomagnum ishizawai]BBL76163.1 RND transporter [Methylomagnum ishizawai]
MIPAAKPTGTALALALLASCAVGPDYIKPETPAPAAFKEAQGWKPAEPRDHALPGAWWEIFGDPQLNALEQAATRDNFSIAQAEAQYRQAQALVQSAWSSFAPTGSATASTNRSRAASGQSVAVSGVRNLFNLALNASWEPDLWGAVRRQVESSEASAQASAATLQGVRLSVQATLAQDYFQLRALDAQKKVLDDTVAAYAKTLELTRNRYGVGVAAKSDVVQAEMQLESARAQAIDLGVQRAQLEHAVAVLAGKPPSALDLAAAPLTAKPPPIPAGVPSELLERRPDIAAAERQVAAANAKIGVAKAAYFPTLTLSASTGFQSYSLSNLFNAARRYWALGPASLSLLMFDGGARSAQMKQAIDAFDASAAAYRQTVLTGFQEVEDQLAALRILEQEYAVQAKAVRAARESVALAHNQYQAGITSYLDVMIVQAAALDNERTAVQVLGDRMVAAVLLVKALGGGWRASALPTPEQAGGEVEWYEYFPVPVR